MADISNSSTVSPSVGSYVKKEDDASFEVFTPSNSSSATTISSTLPGPGQPRTTTLPTINHRALVSLKESARIIGIKGTTIQKIREDNHVKIGLSERQLGCSDRVLSCAGKIIDTANALGRIVSILEEGSTTTDEKYAFHFLNPILPPPTCEEFKGLRPEEIDKIGSLRLIVLNSQLSSIIGKGGLRIKSLKERHNVKIVASRDFLPDCDERILEIQGLPSAISSVLLEISEILLNELDFNFASERRYYPHLRSSPSSISSSNARVTTTNFLNNEFKATLKIPESYVGAIVGRQGNRIANLRKFTKTKIIVEKKTDKSLSSIDPENRAFLILGDHLKNVKLAESLLLKNLEAEIDKRKSRLNKDGIHQSEEKLSDEF